MSNAASAVEYMIKRTDFMVIVPEEDVLTLVRSMAAFFSFNAEFLPSTQVLDQRTDSKVSPVVVFLSLISKSNFEEKQHEIKKVRQTFLRSHILVALSGNETEEERAQLRQAGARFFVMQNEILNSSKLYYLCALLVQGTYLPVPVADFFPSTQMDFNAFHKMPINQSYLPVVFAGFTFSDKKYRKLEAVKQIYIRREDLGKYRTYIETYHDSRGNALKKRCRATLMELMGLYTDLLVSLAYEGEAANETVVKASIDTFLKVADELGAYLKDCPDVWNVIAQSLDFQFCRYERGPYILAYAIYIGNRIGLGNMKDLVLAAALADLGLLDLPVAVFEKAQQKGNLILEASEQERYQNHPIGSLNRALYRKLEMSNEVKSILVCTHERADEKGFPNQVPKDQVPLESQLIQFCQVLDRRVRGSLEEGMVTHDFIRKQVWEEEKVSLACFREDFLDKIEAVVITPVA